MSPGTYFTYIPTVMCQQVFLKESHQMSSLHIFEGKNVMYVLKEEIFESLPPTLQEF